MATATLEMNNPYAKLGLKRRPTYEEIVGLISENQTITGKLPDRTATFYKASPEGSFFDGTDHLELLKEQQNRILERELRGLLLRQNAIRNGTTHTVDRIQSSSGTSTPTEVQPDRETLSLGLQADLMQRERQMRDRQQQTGEAHRSIMSRATTPIIDGLFSLSRQSSRVFGRTGADTPSEVVRIFDSGASTPLHQPTPVRPQRSDTPQGVNTNPEMFVIGSSDESPAEMLTAREEKPKSKLMKQISYSTNISRMSEGELAFQLYIRGVDVNSPDISLEGARKKGKGKGLTSWQHYQNLAQTMIINGQWDTRLEAELLKKRIKEYNDRHKPRGSKD